MLNVGTMFCRWSRFFIDRLKNIEIISSPILLSHSHSYVSCCGVLCVFCNPWVLMCVGSQKIVDDPSEQIVVHFHTYPQTRQQHTRIADVDFACHANFLALSRNEFFTELSMKRLFITGRYIHWQYSNTICCTPTGTRSVLSSSKRNWNVYIYCLLGILFHFLFIVRIELAQMDIHITSF